MYRKRFNIQKIRTCLLHFFISEICVQIKSVLNSYYIFNLDRSNQYINYLCFSKCLRGSLYHIKSNTYPLH